MRPGLDRDRPPASELHEPPQAATACRGPGDRSESRPLRRGPLHLTGARWTPPRRPEPVAPERWGTPAHPLTSRGPFPLHLVGAKANDAARRRPVMDRRTFLGALAGGLLAAPLAAEPAQAGTISRIGLLTPAPGPSPLFRAFREGLEALGYVEGRSVTIEYRFANGDDADTAQAALACERSDYRPGGARSWRRARTSAPVGYASCSLVCPLQN